MLRYPTASQVFANACWKNACENNPGGLPIRMAKIVKPLECEMNVELARRWARKHSKTGLAILDIVARSKQTIHVVGWRGEGEDEGFTMFDSDSPIPGEGTVFINLDVFVEIVESGGQTGRSNVMNSFVVMLHEFGHAKQFLEYPAIFKSGASDSGLDAAQSRNAASAAYDEAAKKRTAEVKLANPKMGYSAASALVKRELGMPPHLAFSNLIEWDNYQKHEGPICDEAGIMRRNFYANIRGSFPSVVKW